MKNFKIAILGAGNIGQSIANGLLSANYIVPENLFLTRRKIETLQSFKSKGVHVSADNIKAVKASEVIILAVEPQQIDTVLEQIKDKLSKDKIIISVATAVTIKQIQRKIAADVEVIRCMPNTAIAIRESMTCLASQNGGKALETAKDIFDNLGVTLTINEEQMNPATALAACGIAFFLRAIRASSQGGIEIGFHSEDALKMAAQTAKGAAALLLQHSKHPEREIDKVTTPRGCTIAGLNKMEHEGFSSAMIKGIVTSAEKADLLYPQD